MGAILATSSVISNDAQVDKAFRVVKDLKQLVHRYVPYVLGGASTKKKRLAQQIGIVAKAEIEKQSPSAARNSFQFGLGRYICCS